MSEFAFGMWDVDCVDCPAIQAGYGRGDLTEMVASEYDRAVRKIVGQDESRAIKITGRTIDDVPARGIIPEEVAKEAWNEVIDKFSHQPDAQQRAVYVANDFGWEWDNDEG